MHQFLSRNLNGTGSVAAEGIFNKKRLFSPFTGNRPGSLRGKAPLPQKELNLGISGNP